MIDFPQVAIIWHYKLRNEQSKSMQYDRLNITRPLFTIVGLWIGAIAFQVPVYAQLTPDDTLGAESSVVTPQNVRDLIEGGAIRDGNLLHSFREFNVNHGQQVYFANPEGIINILTRVTGSNISNIFGTLGVDGGANLFLINPNGIVFGENASLDVSGSFLATTADSLNSDRYDFNPDNPDAPPLLTVNLPPGAQLGDSTITNRGELQVGADLTLQANNLDLEGKLSAGNNLTLLATDTLKIRDSLKNSFIASAGNNLLVQGNNQVYIFALNNANSGLFSQADFMIESDNTIIGDAHFHSGGNFKLNNHLSSPNDPIIFAGGDVNLGDYTGASLHILAGGSVIMGDIKIDAADTQKNTINHNNANLFNGTDTIASLSKVVLSNERTVAIDGSNQPTLDVRAGIDWSTFAGGAPGNVDTDNLNPTFQDNPSSADIKVDSITIADGGDGGDLLLTSQYRPNSSLTGDIFLFGTVDAKDVSQGGRINFDSRGDIRVSGLVDASTVRVDRGDGGDVTLLATDDIKINDGASIVANGLTSGNILLNTQGDISLTGTNNGALIQSHSFIQEPDVSKGKISLISESLLLEDGAKIDTNIFGTVPVINSNIFNTAAVLANSSGDGSVGDINIDASSIVLENGSISAQTNSGTGSNITLQDAQFLILDRDSQIATRAGTENTGGMGGNIAIDSQFVIGFTQGSNDIIAEAFAGDGGNINIVTRQVFGFEPGVESTTRNGINASSEFDIDGEIERDILEFDPRHTVIKLSETLVDSTKQIVAGCPAKEGANFVFRGRGGLPVNPIQELPEQVYVQGFETAPPSSNSATNRREQNRGDNTNAEPKIVEAGSWIVNQQGKVELVARKNQENTGNWQPNFDCN